MMHGTHNVKIKSALTAERTLFQCVQKQYSEGNILTKKKVKELIKIKIVRCAVIITMQLFLLQLQNKEKRKIRVECMR